MAGRPPDSTEPTGLRPAHATGRPVGDHRLRHKPPGLLLSPTVATDPPGDLELTPLDGEARTLSEWLTTFHLAVVIIDPYTYESSWILETAGRILETFSGADCRTAFVVTADEKDTRTFMGPWAKQVLTYTDPDRELVKSLGLSELPAFVYIRQDGSVAAAGEGWDPTEWRGVAHKLADDTGWNRPLIPGLKDPQPFAGSPALG